MMLLLEEDKIETLCSDNEDNDNDSLVDCADPDCTDNTACKFENTDETCHDGTDNDQDAATDCMDAGGLQCLLQRRYRGHLF